MAKFRVPSWLQTPATSGAASSNADKKRQNRRSFTVFSQTMRSKSDTSPLTFDTISQSTNSEVSRLLLLARKIVAEAEKLDTFLNDSDSPQPGFGVSAPPEFPDLPVDLQESRQEIIYATRELERLVRGPRESVRWGVWSVRFPKSISLRKNCLNFLTPASYSSWTHSVFRS